MNGGLNTYGDVGGNPLSWVDPRGLTGEGAALGGTIGAGIGGFLGGALGGVSGSFALPGGGTLAGATMGAAQGAVDGAIIGAVVGDKISNLCDPGKPKCTLALDSARTAFSMKLPGPSYTCVYTQRGSFGMISFPQWKGKSCYPVNLETCLVDTSAMDPALYGKK